MNITISFLTARKSPFIEWFFDSLANQLTTEHQVKLVVVDRWAEERPDWTAQQVSERKEAFKAAFFTPLHGLLGSFTHVPPKPTPWAGKHRLTSRDHFAASNARNTALCLAPDGYIVYVDDLSVLMPGWWNAAVDAVNGRYIACGAFRKVKEIVVERGRVKKWTNHPGGIDCRMKSHPINSDPVPCLGEWFYGCSVAVPTEALLRINGWDEDCDGMGFEDCITGWRLHHHGGYPMMFCPRMFTWESEEGHILDPSEQVGKGSAKPYAGYPDCVHAILDWAKSGKHKLGGQLACQWNAPINDIRHTVLNGGAFPKTFNQDARHWPDSEPIRNM